jgi:hypothetical protein
VNARLTFLVVALLCASATAPAEAQQPSPPPTAAGPPRATVKEAEVAIDKAAARRRIPLSPAAVTALAVEVVRQDASKPPAAAATADARVDEVLTSVAARPAAGEVTADEAKRLVGESKLRQIVPALGREVAAQVSAAGKILTDEARALIVADLETQTIALAGSGLSVEAIEHRNGDYLAALGRLLPDQSAVTPVMYQEARTTLFTHFVTLTIDTVPPGARVRMEGADIGTTSIGTQAVEPGKRYRFEFIMPGYHAPALDFYVTPAPSVQKISEALTPDDAAAGNSVTPVDAAVPKRKATRRSPLFYAGIAAAGLVLGIVLLLRLKS